MSTVKTYVILATGMGSRLKDVTGDSIPKGFLIVNGKIREFDGMWISSSQNFKHVLFNNGAHDSVGGQDTVGLSINLTEIAEACGYKKVYSCSNSEQILEYCSKIKSDEGTVLLEVKVKKGVRENLGRPTRTPIENKNDLMK